MASKQKKKSGINLGDILVGAGILFAVYSLFSGSNSNSLSSGTMTREQAIQILSNAGHGVTPTWGTDYITAWANAIVNHSDIFMLNGKNYSAKNGRAI